MSEQYSLLYCDKETLPSTVLLTIRGEIDKEIKLVMSQVCISCSEDLLQLFGPSADGSLAFWKPSPTLRGSPVSALGADMTPYSDWSRKLSQFPSRLGDAEANMACIASQQQYSDTGLTVYTSNSS